MRISACLVVLLLASPSFGSPADERVKSDEPVTISLVPAACIAPCSVRVTVRVAPEESNRSVTIQAESPDFFRSSTRPLEGVDAARVHELLLSEIPAGLYDVTVTVARSPQSPRHLVKQFYVKDGLAE